MKGDLLLRAVDDRRCTYLTWRRLDDSPVARFAALDAATLQPILDDLHMGLPHTQPHEGPEKKMRRVLEHGILTDLPRETRLAERLGAALLPSQLADELSAVGPGTCPRLRLTPSPRLADVPWEALMLPNGMRLIEVIDVAHDPPSVLHANRDRRPQPWRMAAAAPVLYVLDPAIDPFGRTTVLDTDTATEVRRWFAQGNIVSIQAAIGRGELGERLRTGPSRLVYFGHASAPPDEPDAAALHLSDGPDTYGLAHADGVHRPFTALDLLIGTSDAPDKTEERWPFPGRARGAEIWPMPTRVALIACESGADHRHAEPFGLVIACLNAGAELVTSTRWPLPTDAAFQCFRDKDERFRQVASTDGPGPTTALLRAVDHAHSQPDAIAALARWQRLQLARWTSKRDVGATPLLWSALTSHVAPAKM